MKNIKKNIVSRLSLRKPQEDSLDILSKILDKVNLRKDSDPNETLKTIKSLFASVTDFERNFPSICFSLATGVGKTRLMGAFISYLYLTGKSRHFLVLAPNLTIYEKLKNDFSPSSKKYVFRGINEFVNNQPVIITGENYERGDGIRIDGKNYFGQSNLFRDNDTPIINIFNIGKINSTDNQKKSSIQKSKIPKIKRIQETIGESYFDYLSNLDDLIILMDEAHRYRGTAGSKAINELKPILGIELTATPKTIGSNSKLFKNIIYSYGLPQALNDGYVKEPTVVTRLNFNPEDFTKDEIEDIKLKDGIKYHNLVKTKLQIYSQNKNKKYVKPFVLIVTEDTIHANTIKNKIESEDFFNGSFKNKVAVIHSKQNNAEEDQNIKKLLSIEDPKEITEIVIHVNKLKEGWDVSNLFTIIPLRASASEILTEQTIGRGLRLPYVEKTGEENLDILTIIAHDKFAEIIDKANNENSIIKQKFIGEKIGNISLKESEVVNVFSTFANSLKNINNNNIDQEYKIVELISDQIYTNKELDNSKEITHPENQERILTSILQGKLELNSNQFANEKKEIVLKNLVDFVCKKYESTTIKIPNIVVIPSRNSSFGYKDFDLKNLDTINLQTVEEEILLKSLSTNESMTYKMDNDQQEFRESPENQIIINLIDSPEIDYEEHSDLLYKLAGQLVSHFKSYLKDKNEILNVIRNHGKVINEFIKSQLQENYWEKTEYLTKVSSGFTELTNIKLYKFKEDQILDFRIIPKDKSQVRNLIFSGFKKCCYEYQKFESVDGELRFANILEDDEDVLKWIKPEKGSFKIEYQNGKAYEPDFIVETNNGKYICEPKRASQLEDQIVIEKKSAAIKWCKEANKNLGKHDIKNWHYILIPHNEIIPSMSFRNLVDKFQEY